MGQKGMETERKSGEILVWIFCFSVVLEKLVKGILSKICP